MAGFDYSGDRWLQDLWDSEELTEQLEETGAEILGNAKANAERFTKSGEFLDSISGGLRRSKKGRPFYRVQSDDPAALSIEFGTAKQEPKRALGRAIEVYKDGG
ncbi:hypothetical protein [Kitasatospora aureofaciens]|uniref:hypothetical protein n=1 Tax=Kitasatospora aureofaciens TaxID=1894 RepID=UPI0033CA8EF6